MARYTFLEKSGEKQEWKGKRESVRWETGEITEIEAFESSILNETNSSTKLTLIWWSDCQLLVATTDLHMTIFLMGIESGNFWQKEWGKNKREEQVYWHTVHFK